MKIDQKNIKREIRRIEDKAKGKKQMKEITE